MKFARTAYGRMAGFYDALDRLAGYPARTARNCFLGGLPFAPKNPLEIGCGAGETG